MIGQFRPCPARLVDTDETYTPSVGSRGLRVRLSAYRRTWPGSPPSPIY